MPWLLYPQGKSLQYPLDRRLGEPQSHSGCSGEEKNSRPLPGHMLPRFLKTGTTVLFLSIPDLSFITIFSFNAMQYLQ
jgi:hypothetical protein